MCEGGGLTASPRTCTAPLTDTAGFLPRNLSTKTMKFNSLTISTLLCLLLFSVDAQNVGKHRDGKGDVTSLLLLVWSPRQQLRGASPCWSKGASAPWSSIYMTKVKKKKNKIYNTWELFLLSFWFLLNNCSAFIQALDTVSKEDTGLCRTWSTFWGSLSH